ncbi:hypothetical protein Poli38472_010452 [Pythium oligandrum]|uniref:Gamma-butyrobetaine dioxygenase n=1 Tax=Pythium oligandrum TaxID=41045 RepID=A0A8K1C332_PYTOL|nr:hypothetical protein Poli38472_010452 [Pythium oligandrum]|eukprot:TMW55570.1 hypothetical protein Poli38472_010452 [Pythium oligandrum]
MVAIVNATVANNKIILAWDNKRESSFLNVWLRDNCRCSACYHAVAEERILNSASIPLDIKTKTASVNAETNALEIVWDVEDAHASSYPAAFLAGYSRFPENEKPAVYEEKLWDVEAINADIPTLPRSTYARVMESEEGIHEWLELLNKYGFTILEGVPQGDHRVEEIGRRISIIRNSFWGESSWDVKDKPDPTSLSLTGGDLFPHTDLCFSESQPGVQFLHCREFSADKLVGGESTIVDGYSVAEKIRREQPEVFATLTSKNVPHVFSSKQHYFRFDGPVVKTNPNGTVKELRFNQALISPLEGEADDLVDLYKALQVFANETRDHKNLLHFRLREGEMLVFNNHRMLHGRRGYDAVNTRRHLEGCYLDYEEFVGRLKKLREAKQA